VRHEGLGAESYGGTLVPLKHLLATTGGRSQGY
jgi:hypothetical protein